MLHGVGINAPRRLLAQAVRRLYRLPDLRWQCAACTGILLLSQIFLLVVVGLEGTVRSLERETEIRITISDAATDAAIQDFFQMLRDLPHVARVTYVTREQAFESLRKHDPDLASFATTFGAANLLPETMRVRLLNLSDHAAFIASLRDPRFSSVIDASFFAGAMSQQESLTSHLRMMTAFHTFSLLLLLFLGLLLLCCTVTIARHRIRCAADERFLTTVAGAPLTGMRLSFFFEMLTILLWSLLCSIVLALACVVLIGISTLSSINVVASLITTAQPLLLSVLPYLLFLEILSVVLIAFLAMLLSSSDGLQPQRSAPLSSVAVDHPLPPSLPAHASNITG